MTRSLFRHYLSIVLAIIMVMGLVPITVKANVTGILDDAAIGITGRTRKMADKGSGAAVLYRIPHDHGAPRQ